MTIQAITSADTSLNQVAALFKKVTFPAGSKVLDYGGGRFDTAAEYMAENGVFLGVYDPYNRTPEHNAAVMELFKRPDFITCNNVLNVIAENDVIDGILSTLASYGVPVFISVYEGDRTGRGRATTKGYQRNMRSADYTAMLEKHFDAVSLKNGIFTCR